MSSRGRSGAYMAASLPSVRALVLGRRRPLGAQLAPRQTLPYVLIFKIAIFLHFLQEQNGHAYPPPQDPTQPFSCCLGPSGPGPGLTWMTAAVTGPSVSLLLFPTLEQKPDPCPAAPPPPTRSAPSPTSGPPQCCWLRQSRWLTASPWLSGAHAHRFVSLRDTLDELNRGFQSLASCCRPAGRDTPQAPAVLQTPVRGRQGLVESRVSLPAGPEDKKVGSPLAAQWIHCCLVYSSCSGLPTCRPQIPATAK